MEKHNYGTVGTEQKHESGKDRSGTRQIRKRAILKSKISVHSLGKNALFRKREFRLPRFQLG